MTSDSIVLYGRLFVTGNIRAVTGLHIGRGSESLEIGGVDSPIIRDPLTRRPYVPGSSLKGKLRSLREKASGSIQNTGIGQGVRIHVCRTAKDEKGRDLPATLQPYNQCDVCPVFGVPGEVYANAPTRLIVRDVFLGSASARALEEAQTDMPYSETKTEVAIDRITSQATPRQIERVPAGAVFEGFEMVYSVYDAADVDRLTTVVEAMQLLEDDYLGGLGSRGGGKILFENLTIYARNRANYGRPVEWGGDASSVASILAQEEALIDWARQTVPSG